MALQIEPTLFEDRELCIRHAEEPRWRTVLAGPAPDPTHQAGCRERRIGEEYGYLTTIEHRELTIGQLVHIGDVGELVREHSVRCGQHNPWRCLGG